MFAVGYEPAGWAVCDGRTLPIAQNQALYSLLGNRFGGSVPNFCLPDLRGRTPIAAGLSAFGSKEKYRLGAVGGSETVALAVNQMPAHSHVVNCRTDPAKESFPTNNVPASAESKIYAAEPTEEKNLVKLKQPETVSSAGAGSAHANMQPFLTLNFCIALTGTFPPRAV